MNYRQFGKADLSVSEIGVGGQSQFLLQEEVLGTLTAEPLRPEELARITSAATPWQTVGLP